MSRMWLTLALVAGCTWGTPAPIEEPAAAPAEMVDTTLQVDSMKACNRCAMNVRMAIREYEGVERVHVNIATGVLIVTHDKSVLKAEQLVVAAAKAKQQAVVVSEGPPAPTAPKAVKGTDDTDGATDDTDAAEPVAP